MPGERCREAKNGDQALEIGREGTIFRFRMLNVFVEMGQNGAVPICSSVSDERQG
jgi:hypothetical protein